MKNFLLRLKNKLFYIADTFQNRYPCRIVKISHCFNSDKDTSVTYQALTKFNLKELKLAELLETPELVAKFHPTECVKLGFLAAGKILLKEGKLSQDAEQHYEKVAKKMLSDYQSD